MESFSTHINKINKISKSWYQKLTSFTEIFLGLVLRLLTSCSSPNKQSREPDDSECDIRIACWIHIQRSVSSFQDKKKMANEICKESVFLQGQVMMFTFLFPPPGADSSFLAECNDLGFDFWRAYFIKKMIIKIMSLNS